MFGIYIYICLVCLLTEIGFFHSIVYKRAVFKSNVFCFYQYFGPQWDLYQDNTTSLWVL